MTKILYIRVTEAEHALLKRSADLAEQSLTDFCKDILIPVAEFSLRHSKQSPLTEKENYRGDHDQEATREETTCDCTQDQEIEIEVIY